MLAEGTNCIIQSVLYQFVMYSIGQIEKDSVFVIFACLVSIRNTYIVKKKFETFFYGNPFQKIEAIFNEE